MADVIGRYLEKRGIDGAWPLRGSVPDTPAAVVVIPCLAESGRLFATLEDLRAQGEDALARALVLCVVNNRPPGIASGEDIEDNRRTLERLASFQAPPLRLAWIDAASPGCELSPEGGVGLARKIGLDAGLRLLHERGVQDGFLVCLDADTRVAPDYLGALHHFFSARRWAGVLPYAHPLEPAAELPAILCYELFLRYHELGLRQARSPYAFHTIGSTIACTARAYAAVSGMNRKQAGEDFYFLQQLAKTGVVERIPASPVIPAARASHRVPFGTGRRVQRHLLGERNEYLLYHPRSYGILRNWLEIMEMPLGPEEVLRLGEALSPALAEFLRQQSFTQAVGRISAQSKTDAQRRMQLHRWFDGFRTLKLLHFLRDSGYPDMDMFEAIALMCPEYGMECSSLPARSDLEGQINLLLALRRKCDDGTKADGLIP